MTALLTMADDCFKSALPAHYSSLFHDSSLALPAEPNPRSARKVGPNDRSLRVHQQVQLTLARRARNSGSVSLQKHSAKSFDASNGALSDVKVNGWGSLNSSLSSNLLRKPSRRVEVSPPPTPELPHQRFNHSSFSYGTYSHPAPSQSHRVDTLLDRSFASDSLGHYAFSELPRVTHLHASTAPWERLHQKSCRRPALESVFPKAAFEQSVRYDPHQSYSLAADEEEDRVAQGQCGDFLPDAAQHDDDLAWLASVRRQTRKLSRTLSYPPAFNFVEGDFDRQLEVEPPVQQMQAQNVTTQKPVNKPVAMTLERAVSLLSHDSDEDTLIEAASYICDECSRHDDIKKRVCYLHGIEKLLQLLDIDHEGVQHAAAGALRNVVYQSSQNKMEVKEKGGLATILLALRSTRDVPTRRELTGLLWNLSSHDLLKERLAKESLSVLTKSVLVPSSGISDGENPKDELLADATVFYNAIGCLKNLSSTGPDGRKAMRECEDLIDSLVSYIRGAIADYKTDDKSTENCVCILSNLSYQVEAELPKKYARDLRESLQSLAPEPKSVGCFAHRSAKITENLQRQCPLLEDNPNPRGIEWLWSTITVRMYLSLMACSVRPCTQEAAVGALQNITAGNGLMSEAIAITIVQRENGLQHVKKMLEVGESEVKRTTVSLIRNLSYHPELHFNICNELLPELVEMLPSDDTGIDLPTEVTASLCYILNNVSQSDSQHAGAILNEGALPKIIGISSNDNGYGPTRAGQAAGVLLHTMWKHSNLHGTYKRRGYRKSDFINTRTIKAINSG